AEVIVARRAIDVVALLTALEIGFGNRERELVRFHAVFFAGVEQLIEAQLATRHRSSNRLALRASISEESGRFVRQILRLDVHVQPATGQRQDERNQPGGAAARGPRGHRSDFRIAARIQLQKLPADSVPARTLSSLPNRTSCRAT